MYKFCVGFLFVLLPVQLLYADSKLEDDSKITNADASVGGNHSSPYVQHRRKCCLAHQAFTSSSLIQCVQLTNNTLTRLAAHNHSMAPYLKFNVIRELSCSVNQQFLMLVLNESSGDQFTLHSHNGTIHHSTYNVHYNYGDYCYEYFIEDDQFRPVVCVNITDDAELSDTSSDQFHLGFYHSYTLAVSVGCLLATLVLFLATPKLHRKLRDKCFMCHVATLILGFSWLIAIQNVGTDNRYCICLAYMTQFWVLASFCWLNVMCIDMWRSINTATSLRRSPGRTFVIYCLYAWGCPFLVSCITLGANDARIVSVDSLFRPGFGDEVCWFKDYVGHFWLDPRFMYFYGIIFATLLVNLYVFADTAFSIFIQNKACKPDKKKLTRFFLCLKLFLVMGLNWFLEVASYYFKNNDGVWMYTDFVNTLQGVFIFIIFVFNKRVMMLLKERFLGKKISSSKFSGETFDLLTVQEEKL